MPCDETRSRIDRYLDGALNPAERRQIEEHLDLCSDCRDVARFGGDLAKALTELPDVSCPESVVRRIEEATVGRPGEASPLGRVRRFLSPRRLAIALPAVFATTALVLIVATNRPEQASMSGPSTQEIQLAGKQARWALSYVVQKIDEDGRQRTGDFVSNDIPAAIQNCLDEAIPRLKGEL